MKETARGPEVPAQVLTIAIRDRSKIPMQIEFHFGVIEDNSWTHESVVHLCATKKSVAVPRLMMSRKGRWELGHQQTVNSSPMALSFTRPLMAQATCQRSVINPILDFAKNESESPK